MAESKKKAASKGVMQKVRAPFSKSKKKNSKKTLNVLYLVAFGGLLLASAWLLSYTTSSGSVKLTEFRSQEEPVYFLSYPQGWNVAEVPGRSSFSEPATEGDEFQADMQVAISDFTQIDEEVTKEEIFDEFRQNAAAQFESQDPSDSDYASNIRDEEVVINGYDVLLYTIDIDNIDGVQGESGSGQVAIIYIDSVTVATIFVEAHESDSQYVDAFAEILESFGFPDAESAPSEF